MSTIEITDNSAENRFEAHVDGELAGFAQYRFRGDAIVFPHTEVATAFEGQGIGGAIARYALDAVRADEGLRVVPLCPFIRAWIEKHPEYASLVAPPPPAGR